MAAALGLARRNLGQTAPNPSVGCIIVRDGRVVGRGWTAQGGRPHAETQALRQAGKAARGATAYVTLEPCCHHGRTPPCTQALTEARVSRVVVACADPDPRVSGGGLAALKLAGIDVETGLLETEAAELNAGFFLRVTAGRPLVTLKLATSLDGRIATRTGESRWITGDASRARGHMLRAESDAILIGTGTALADDPELTCRLPGLETRSPVRIVLDRYLRLDLLSKLAQTADAVETWVVTLPGNPQERLQAFSTRGLTVIELDPDADGRIDLASALRVFGERGVCRLLVEGGGQVAAGLLSSDLVDRLAWFRAPLVLGGDGIPAIAGLGLERLADSPRFELMHREILGDDVLETFRLRR